MSPTLCSSRDLQTRAFASSSTMFLPHSAFAYLHFNTLYQRPHLAYAAQLSPLLLPRALYTPCNPTRSKRFLSSHTIAVAPRSHRHRNPLRYVPRCMHQSLLHFLQFHSIFRTRIHSQAASTTLCSPHCASYSLLRCSSRQPCRRALPGGDTAVRRTTIVYVGTSLWLEERARTSARQHGSRDAPRWP